MQQVMIFSDRQHLGLFFRAIQASGLLLALVLALTGGYQVFLGEFLMGAVMVLLGMVIFFGAARLKAYSFQIAFFAYLFVAFGVLISAWSPPPEPSFSVGPYASLLLTALLLTLAVGSVSLARYLSLGSRRAGA